MVRTHLSFSLPKVEGFEVQAITSVRDECAFD